MNRIPKSWIITTVMLKALLLAHVAHAELLVYEPFDLDINEGDSFMGHGSGFGWEGNWGDNNNVGQAGQWTSPHEPSQDRFGAEVAFSNLETAGGAAHLYPQRNEFIGRIIDLATSPSSSEIWGSFIYQADDSTLSFTHIGTGLWMRDADDPENDYGIQTAVHAQPAPGITEIYIAGTTDTADRTLINDGNPYLIIFRLAGADATDSSEQTLTLWALNPGQFDTFITANRDPATLDEAGNHVVRLEATGDGVEPAASALSDGNNLQLRHFIEQIGGDAFFLFDEIRIGTTLASVTPTTAPPEQPVITSQPASQSIEIGDTAMFTVEATGGQLSFQWSKDGVEIAGATNASLTIEDAELADAGDYTVVVSNPVDTDGVTSDAATLTVTEPAIVIDDQPQSQVVGLGETAEFTVQATGDNLSYQWYKDGVPIGIIYRETFDFPENPDPDDLVFPEDLGMAATKELVGWIAHQGAAEFPANNGFIISTSPGEPTGAEPSIPGFAQKPDQATEMIAWTEAVSFDPADYQDLKVSFYLSSSGAPATNEVRLAIRIDDTWYATDAAKTMTDPTGNFGATGGGYFQEYTFSTDAADWRELAFDGTFDAEGTELTLGSDALATDLPSGVVDAIGLHFLRVGSGGTHRFDTFTVSGLHIDETRYSGYDTDTLTISDVEAGDAGTYTVVISNPQRPQGRESEAATLSTLVAPLADATVLGENAYESSWFGTFYYDGTLFPNWVYSPIHGWIYVWEGQSAGAMWYWDVIMADYHYVAEEYITNDYLAVYSFTHGWMLLDLAATATSGTRSFWVLDSMEWMEVGGGS